MRTAAAVPTGSTAAPGAADPVGLNGRTRRAARRAPPA
jgi:hypothetical protein